MKAYISINPQFNYWEARNSKNSVVARDFSYIRLAERMSLRGYEPINMYSDIDNDCRLSAMSESYETQN